MRDLYGLNGQKYFALLLICQLGIFLIGLIAVSLFIIKFDGVFDVPYSIISIPLWVLYGILALWVGLLWEALSGTVFRLDFIEWLIFQRWFLIPTLALCLLGAYTTHTLLLLSQDNNHFPFTIVFAPLFFACGLGILVTSIMSGRVLWVIQQSKKNEILCQDKLAELKESFGSDTIRRIENSTNLAFGRTIGNPLSSQRGFVLIGITSKPWYERSNFSWANSLEKCYEIIRQEALKIMEKKTLTTPYFYPGVNKGTWNSFMLIQGGKKKDENCLHCPKTLELLENVPDYPKFREAMFSILEPGACIKPHRDYGNAYLTCQLGLVIPEKCNITVGGESRSWKEGECIFFDTSYEHTVSNNSDTFRIVLIVDFFHPEITDVEKEFLPLVC